MTGDSTAASDAPTLVASTAPSDERTPLIKKNQSRVQFGDEVDSTDIGDGEDEEGKEVEVWVPGKSTFGQTLLNVLGDIIGTGLLACPIAIAHAGWVVGPIMMAIVALTTLYTLKIMLRIIEKDRRLRSFTDVMGAGLGPRGIQVITAVFVIEVAFWIIALVVLFSDTLNAVFPVLTSDQWKLVGLLLVIPTSFLPLRFLSFTSGIGLIATWTLVGVLVFSGIVTQHSPGSLREPAHTDLWPTHGWVKFGTVTGLLIAGYGGHGLIPTVIHDMKDPRQADRVCEVAYGIAFCVYAFVSICGYLMYGTNVSDEISKDLAQTAGTSSIINKIAVLTVAVNPLTKLPLGLRPLADVIFSAFHLHPTLLIPKDVETPHVSLPPTPPDSSPPGSPSLSRSRSNRPDLPESLADLDIPHMPPAAEWSHDKHERLKYWLRPCIRVLLAVLAVVGGLVMPSFEKVLNLLGSMFGIAMAILLPMWVSGKIFGWKWWMVIVWVIAALLAVYGTIASFIPG